MKRATAILFLVLVVAVLAAIAAHAKGILPAMVYRRGLTNEQIDQILAAHPDAQLLMTVQDWRAMRYQLFRFDCMTNYVELIGGTNDAARVLLELHDRAETLATTNAALERAANYAAARYNAAAERAQEYAAAYADMTNRLAALSLDYTAATNRATVAEAKVARTEAFKAWLIEQRDKAVLQTTKAIYQAIIDRLEAE